MRAQQRPQGRLVDQRTINVIFNQQQAVAMYHLGNGLLAFATHAGTGRVLQAWGEHHDPCTGCSRDPIQVLGEDPLPVLGNAVQGQAQLAAGGLDARRSQGLDQHRFAGLAQRQQQAEQRLLGTATQ
ncbi:hypothetical protein D3C85_1359960 [compost metagenome]